MVLTTDHDGKAWVEVCSGDTTVRFAIAGDAGVPFAPYRQIEIEDARFERVVAQLLASFGAETVPVQETPAA